MKFIPDFHLIGALIKLYEFTFLFIKANKDRGEYYENMSLFSEDYTELILQCVSNWKS